MDEKKKIKTSPAVNRIFTIKNNPSSSRQIFISPQ